MLTGILVHFLKHGIESIATAFAVAGKEERVEDVDSRQEHVIGFLSWMRVDLMIHDDGRRGRREGAEEGCGSGREGPAASGEDAAGDGGRGQGIAAGTEVGEEEEVEDEGGGAEAAVGGGKGVEDLNGGVVTGG
jgi:hypothetical protein